MNKKENELRALSYLTEQYWLNREGLKYNDLIERAIASFETGVKYAIIEDVALRRGYENSIMASMMCRQLYYKSKRKLIAFVSKELEIQKTKKRFKNI